MTLGVLSPQLVNGELDTASVDELEFGDWVKSRVYIHGKRYDSALNTYMMQGWQDAQRALYRSYAITAKGAADARSLTDSEREKLELVVQIKSGSSDQEADHDGCTEGGCSCSGGQNGTNIKSRL